MVLLAFSVDISWSRPVISNVVSSGWHAKAAF